MENTLNICVIIILVMLLVVIVCGFADLEDSEAIGAGIGNTDFESLPDDAFENTSMSSENASNSVDTDMSHASTLEYFDVPLSEELQDYIISLCDGDLVDPAIIISIIAQESNYQPQIIGDRGESFGLMQIQPRWHDHRMQDLGCFNLQDPVQNVTVGISYFTELMATGKGVEWALMAYNGGPSYADAKADVGEVSSYAREVIERAQQFETYTVVCDICSDVSGLGDVGSVDLVDAGLDIIGAGVQ